MRNLHLLWPFVAFSEYMKFKQYRKLVILNHVLGTPPMIKAQQRNLQTIARASCQEKGQREKLHPKQWIAVSRVAFALAVASFISTGLSENDLIFLHGHDKY